MNKLTNVSGRITYITSKAKQENLYATYATTSEKSFWRELAKYNQTEFMKSGTDGKCIEARELIIALPESFVHYNPEYLLKRFTDYFKQNYKVECISALHHNKRKTNYHIHLIFAERQLLEKPIEKIATRNMFYDENGKHRRTKKEILDENGDMGKSLAGKELGQGITQRKDGRYQARFTNRFGKRQTIYGKTINEIRQKLRTEQYEDEKKLNVIDSNMTLDEWFDVWMDTCKKNCRDSTRQNYRVTYNRIKASLGWRKLSSLNLIVMQQAFNELKTDASRKDSKRILIDMFNKAIDADLLNKNIAKQINTVVTKDGRPEEPRVLTLEETDWFLEAASHYRNFNEFSLALETGMRIGEILGLQWSDIDFENQTIYVNRTLVYAKCDDENDPMYGKWRFAFHDPKTDKGRRKIPMTLKAYQILKKQRLWKSGIEGKGRKAPEGYEDLVFVTTKNTPISPRDTTVVMKLISDRIASERPEFEPLTPHTLRHTFATRCIERGMNPKTLQIILGHSAVHITMNLYCHVTEDMLVSEMSKFENGASEQGVNYRDGVKVV